MNPWERFDIVIGIGVAVFVVLELVARGVLRRSAYYVFPRFYRRRLLLDKESHPANLEHDIYFEANADGERAGPCPVDPGLFRILLAGGSTVESAVNDQHTCWSSRLEALLNAASPPERLGPGPVHVGNVGRAGLDMRAVGLVLERTLPRYPKLDMIGLMVGPGSLMRWLGAGAPTEKLPDPIPATSVFAESPEHEYGWNPRKLALAEVVRRARLRFLRPIDVRENAARWMARARRLRQNAERFIVEVPPADRFLDAFEAEIERAVTVAKGHSTTVVLFRQPRFEKQQFTPAEEQLLWNGGIGNPFLGEKPTVFYSTEVMYALLDRLDERIARVAARQGVRVIDPTGGVTMSAKAFIDHFHLTPAGADELAVALAAALMDGSDAASTTPART